MGELATGRRVVFGRRAGAGLRPVPGGGKVLDEPGLRRRQGATESEQSFCRRQGLGLRGPAQNWVAGVAEVAEEVVAWSPQVLPRTGPPPGQVVPAPVAPSCGGKASESLSFYANSSSLLQLLPSGGGGERLCSDSVASGSSFLYFLSRLCLQVPPSWGCPRRGVLPALLARGSTWDPSSRIRVPAGVLSALLLVQWPASGEGRWQ